MEAISLDLRRRAAGTVHQRTEAISSIGPRFAVSRRWLYQIARPSAAEVAEILGRFRIEPPTHFFFNHFGAGDSFLTVVVSPSIPRFRKLLRMRRTKILLENGTLTMVLHEQISATNNTTCARRETLAFIPFRCRLNSTFRSKRERSILPFMA